MPVCMVLRSAHRTEAADPGLKEPEVFPSASYRLRYLEARFSPASLIGLHCSKVVRGIREAEGIKVGSSRARKTEAGIRYICLKYTARTTRFKPGGSDSTGIGYSTEDVHSSCVQEQPPQADSTAPGSKQKAHL